MNLYIAHESIIIHLYTIINISRSLKARSDAFKLILVGANLEHLNRGRGMGEWHNSTSNGCDRNCGGAVHLNCGTEQVPMASEG